MPVLSLHEGEAVYSKDDESIVSRDKESVPFQG
jgi:hypothetical protein